MVIRASNLFEYSAVAIIKFLIILSFFYLLPFLIIPFICSIHNGSWEFKNKWAVMKLRFQLYYSFKKYIKVSLTYNYISFRCYNIVILHLNTLGCDHNDKFNNHLSPNRTITMLLTILPVWYIISSWLIYNSEVIPLIPHHFFTHSLLPSGSHQFVFFMSIFFVF